MAKIHGFVTDVSGGPIKGALIAFKGIRTGESDEVKSSAKGEYSTKDLKNGDYEWTAEADGHLPANGLFRLRGTTETVENENIVLEKAGAISGKVMDASGNGVKGVKVTAANEQKVEQGSTVTDDKGDYSIPNLLPGTYSVSTPATAGFQASKAITVKLEQGRDATGIDFQLASTDQSGSISGRVANPTGKGVKGADVTATDITGKEFGPVATDANGAYSITDLDAGEYKVTVKAPQGFESPPAKSVAVQRDQEAEGVDFQLAASGKIDSIQGRVTDKAGNGIGGRDVASSNAQNQVIGQAQTDANGAYALQDLPPGKYTVAVLDDNGKNDTKFLPAYNVEVIAGAVTRGIDFSENVVKDFLDRLDDARFSIESLISIDEANQAVSLFSVVNLMLAGLTRVTVGNDEKIDILGVLILYYGLQENSLRDRLTVENPTILWSNLEVRLRDLARELDILQSDVDFLGREARRQFNLGLNNNVLANAQFPTLFKRFVEIGSDPLLSFDIKAADQRDFFDKTKIAEADDMLKELKSLILQIVRSLSKYGTAATKRVNEDWASFESKSLEVLSIVARDRVTPDQDEKNAWTVLADLTDRNRETEVAPYVVLARHGGKLLKFAMDIYGETQNQLDDFDTAHLRDLFQRGNVQKDFWTERIRKEATVIKRYPLANWG